MDLLYLHISGIPENETLVGVYIVDGVTLYASTKISETEYKLYKVVNHCISDLIHQCNNLGKLDTFVANKHLHIIEQSGKHEGDIKVVTYKTDQLRKNSIKKPSSERQEITRYTSTRMKRLF